MALFSVCALLLLMSRTDAANGVVDARLVNGDRRCSGHLEIKHRGQWRTLMLQSGLNSARSSFAEVACRQMDCGSVVSFKIHMNTTEPKPAWDVYFPCRGRESTIQECRDGASRKKVDDIESTVMSTFVECSDSLRLKDRYFDSCSGRVTLKSGQNWTYVCETETPQNEDTMTRLMCAELGCGLNIGYRHTSIDTAVESTIIQCHGNETQLEQCPASAHSHCRRVLHISCGNPYSVRAVGESRCRGVVEGKNGMEWRPLTRSLFENQDRQIMHICEAMGCGSVISSSFKHFDQEQPMWMMEYDCRDSTFCTRWRDTREYIGLEIVCTEAVRLLRQSKCKGHVEVHHKGYWQILCHEHFTPRNAFVSCRDLGCGFPRESTSQTRVILRNPLRLNCSGQEEHLVDCPKSSLPAEDVNIPCTLASIKCESTPIEPEVTMFSRLAEVQPKALHAYDGHRIFITCSIDSRVPVKSFYLKYSSNDVTELKGNQSAVDNAAQFVFEAELNQNGSYHCSYDYEFSPGVFSEKTFFSLYVKESLYARLSGRESRCLGRLELEHEGEWRPASQEQWGLKEAAVVCRQLHCGSVISTHLQSPKLQPVWSFYSDCDGSERALLDCGSVRKWMSSYTVHVLCSDLVPPPNITVLADRLYPENTEQVVVHEGHSFFVNCSVEPGFPGGRFSLAFSGSKKLNLSKDAINYSAVFKFNEVTSDYTGNYSCVFHNTVSHRDFTFESKTVTITVEESGDIKLDDGRDDGSKSCSGTLFMKNRMSQMKMVTVETSAWDMRHASVVCRQLGCGDAVSASKVQLQTFKSMWRFFSDCDGTEAALLVCGHIDEWFSSTAVQVVCAGNN